MRAHNSKLRSRRAKLQLGVSLVELIVTIVVVGLSVAGILLALTLTLRASADPLIEKQALAIAEALLEEVELMPFTYCDPDDPNAAAASDTSGCTGGATGVYNESKSPLGPETIGAPETRESRYGTAYPFDNVSDYNGYDTGSDVPPGIKDISGTAIAGLGDYRAAITIAEQAIPAVGTIAAVPAADSLLITVTVTGPAHVNVTLHGYRTRYAPNALP